MALMESLRGVGSGAGGGPVRSLRRRLRTARAPAAAACADPLYAGSHARSAHSVQRSAAIAASRHANRKHRKAIIVRDRHHRRADYGSSCPRAQAARLKISSSHHLSHLAVSMWSARGEGSAFRP